MLGMLASFARTHTRLAISIRTVTTKTHHSVPTTGT